RSTGKSEGPGSRGRVSLLTFFGETKKVSSCRATPGEGLIEERTASATTHTKSEQQNKKSRQQRRPLHPT
ncbi:hypothetical protein E4P30_22880, partial [Herbaspirillum sp. 3C11]